MNTELNPISVAKWKNLTENDCHEWKLMIVDPQERNSNTRYEICYACSSNQLPGREPTDVDDALAY